MAPGEDKPEAVILDLLLCTLSLRAGGVVDAGFEMGNEISLRSLEAHASAHGVDRFEACC